MKIILKRRLIIRLLAILITVVSLISALSVLYFNYSISGRLKEFLHRTVANTGQFAEISYATPLWNFDQESIEGLNKAVLQNDMFIAVNAFSDTIFVTGLKKNITKGTTTLETIKTPYIRPKNSPLKMFKKNILYTNPELDREKKEIGYLEIYYTEEFILRAIRESNNNIIVSFIIIALTIIFIIFIGFNQMAIKPIINLAEISQTIARSNNFSIRVEKTTEDEIGFLYDGFNTMLEQIEKREEERDTANRELEKARNLLDNVINSMPSMLISTNNTGIVTQWNEAAARNSGVLAAHAIGKKLWDITPRFQKYQDQYDAVIKELRTIEFNREEFLNSESCDIEDTRLYNVTLFPLIANGSQGVVIRMDDITELEEKEEQLRQTQKMETVGTLAGGLAHDFNNMLGGIAGSLSLLRFKAGKNKELPLEVLNKYLDIIEESTDRAADLVQQLLTLSRKQEINFAPVDLNLTVKHVNKICKNTFDKSIIITPNFYPETVIVNGDPTQLEQVILNLCINAGHAMTIMKKEGQQHGGTLTINFEEVTSDAYFTQAHPEAEEGNYWRISISDTGIGMDKKTAAKIYEPFFTTKGKGLGTGLGLSVVYNIIKQHKGFIDLYSEIGQGTTFNIYFPALDRETMETVSVEEKDIPRGSGLVLVVDDEQVMREIAKSIFEECGYEMTGACDGVEAVNIFKEQHQQITCVLLDMAMPNKSGKETFIEMKEIDDTVKVLLTSGLRHDERVEEIMKLGVKGFLQKPFTLEKLARAIDEILNGGNR
ncbi:MAG: response regulator [bacterium]|nr:response regulator [bacterium]